MRARLLAATLALAAALVAAPAVAAAKSTSAGCAGRGASLIRQTGLVQVFRSGPRRSLQACLRGHRPRVIHADCRSDITTVCRFFPSYVVAGRYLFFGEQVNDRGASLFTYIDRLDLGAPPARDKQWIAGGPGEQVIPTDKDKSRLTDFVARSDGGAAWIYENAQVTPTVVEVHSESGGTEPVLVASSPTIAPGSLAVAGTTLYWSDSGAPRSARLP